MQNDHPVLRIEKLEKIFKTRRWFSTKTTSFTAVKKISFSLHKGEILGLLGPNGAGKTTTMQMLLGTLTPTSGKIYYFDKDFSKYRSSILEHVSFASAYTKLLGALTVYENLSIYARLYGFSPAEYRSKIDELLAFFGILKLRDKPARTLSSGQMTRVMLVKAFMTNPEIVLLDEPTAALDPEIARTVRQFILQQQNKRNIAILFTSHNMDEVGEVCDRILVLKEGTIIADDTPENLAASISIARVELIISEEFDAAINYIKRQALVYAEEKNSLIISVEEHKIAQLLAGLASAGVIYSQISINKPTLEDYFIQVAQHNIEARKGKI
ncbi:ABC transporter ATP-binding protein [Candidatus Dependentiae bacterium]|nr:MAG: ABC transporter ATP-binding protein [Candidatus Dependentiae bacterium]